MAVWIWSEAAPAENAYVRFEDSFYLDNMAAIHSRISVSGEYVLYINGKFAGFGQYSDWPDRRSINIHDITALCHSGKNAFLLIVWHQGLDCSVDVAGPGRTWFEVVQADRLVLESKAGTPCRQDTRYQQGPMWKLTPQLGYGFAYDSRVALPPLEHAAAVTAPSYMSPRPLAQLMLHDCCEGICRTQGIYWDTAPKASLATRMRRAALSMRTAEEMRTEADWICRDDGDGIYLIYDLGQETSGFFHMDADFDCETEVVIGYGEHLQDLRVRTDIDGRSFCARYHAIPGHNEFTHWFRRWGARYLQLHIGAKCVRIHRVGLLPVAYPTKPPRPFHSSDLLHDRIYETSLNTLKLCMHNHYEDTPWREQALYAMDARLQMLSGYYAFGEAAMPRESLRLLARGQRADGLLELCAPAKVSITIPAFSLQFINAVWEYVLHTGDRDFGAEMMPTIDRILAAFAKRCDSLGRMCCFTEKKYWNFYEWQPGLDGGEIHAITDHKPRLEGPLTAYYALALEAAEHLCEEAGLSSGDLENQRLHVIAGMRTFWNEENCLFSAFIENGDQSVYSALMQSLSLLCGAAEGLHASLVRTKLSTGKDLIPVTLSNALFRYQALLQDEDTYADLIFNEIGHIWGNMLYQGATSFWETALGEQDFHNAGSLCHAWSAIPVYFYIAYGQGIRPNAPGAWTTHPSSQTVLHFQDVK